MSSEHPIKQILIDGREYWDHSGTPAHLRQELEKIIKCGTIALGAQVYASRTESRLVYHTCKSRFCTRCGQLAITEPHTADTGASVFTASPLLNCGDPSSCVTLMPSVTVTR